MTIWLANAVATMVVVFGSMPIVTSIALVFFGLADAAQITLRDYLWLAWGIDMLMAKEEN